MKKQGESYIKTWMLENGSYKLVALFVTLILWVTILGRRDFELSKDVELNFLLPRSLTIAESPSEQHVTLKVSGPRMALKKFAQNPGPVTIDLARAQAGPVHVVISPRSVDVPFGVKVKSVSPEVVNVTLVPITRSNDEAIEGKNTDGDRGAAKK